MSARFERFIAIDWSGAVGERHRGIAVAQADGAHPGSPPEILRPCHRWSRADVLALLHDLAEPGAPATLVGLDLGISLPFADCGGYFPGLPISPPDARALWALVDQVCAADPHLAATSFTDHPDYAPFFRRPTNQQGAREGARFRCDDALHGQGRFRVTELAQAKMGCRPTSNFNLVGAAQVGKASLTGMRLLHQLAGAIPVWPVDLLPAHGSAIVEIYTGLAAIAGGRTAGRSKLRSFAELNIALATLGSAPVAGAGPIDDHRSDALLTAAWLRANAHRPALWRPPAMSSQMARTEGWTFGAH